MCLFLCWIPGIKTSRISFSVIVLSTQRPSPHAETTRSRPNKLESIQEIGRTPPNRLTDSTDRLDEVSVWTTNRQPSPLYLLTRFIGSSRLSDLTFIGTPPNRYKVLSLIFVCSEEFRWKITSFLQYSDRVWISLSLDYSMSQRLSVTFLRTYTSSLFTVGKNVR